MNSVLEMSNREIIDAAQRGGVNTSSTRVAGIFFDVDYTPLFTAPLSAGGSAVAFVGVDLITNQRVVAYYGGVTMGAGYSAIPGGNFTVGAFGFTGEPSALGGWSVGGQISAGPIGAGTSINIDGSGILYFAGGGLAVGASVGGGYTFSVSVANESIYYFGAIHKLAYDGSQMVLAHQALNSIPRGEIVTIKTNNFINADGIYLVQELRLVGDKLHTTTYFEDSRGVRLQGQSVQGLLEGFGDIRSVRDGTALDISDYKEVDKPLCFAAGTLISMADGTQKSIETIQPDDMVLAFDPEVDAGRGALVPSRVVRTFVNQNQMVIDFHGTGVTPGHAYLCGDGPHEGRFRQIMDIIRDDGAVVRDDGSLMRAATGCAVGSAGDAFVELQLAHPAREKATGREVMLLKERSRVRAGTRVERPDGTSFSFLELIEENGWTLCENGFVGQGEGHEPEPLMWSGRAIPKPEDYILAKSRLTLADLYDDPRELAMPGGPAGAPTARRDAPATTMQAGSRQAFAEPASATASVSPSRKARRKAEAEQRKEGRVRKHAGMTVQ